MFITQTSTWLITVVRSPATHQVNLLWFHAPDLTHFKSQIYIVLNGIFTVWWTKYPRTKDILYCGITDQPYLRLLSTCVDFLLYIIVSNWIWKKSFQVHEQTHIWPPERLYINVQTNLIGSVKAQLVKPKGRPREETSGLKCNGAEKTTRFARC